MRVGAHLCSDLRDATCRGGALTPPPYSHLRLLAPQQGETHGEQGSHRHTLLRVELHDPKRYVGILTHTLLLPRTLELDLIWKEGRCRCNELR